MLGPTHNDLSADEVQRRIDAARIDRLRRYLQTGDYPGLRDELTEAENVITLYDEAGQEVAS